MYLHNCVFIVKNIIYTLLICVSVFIYCVVDIIFITALTIVKNLNRRDTVNKHLNKPAISITEIWYKTHSTFKLNQRNIKKNRDSYHQVSLKSNLINAINLSKTVIIRTKTMKPLKNKTKVRWMSLVRGSTFSG